MQRSHERHLPGCGLRSDQQGLGHLAGATPQRTCADNNSGIYPDCFDSTSTYMTIDSTTYRSGGGSMLATIPGTAGSDPTGYYRRLFQSSQSNGPGTATVFGQNSDF